MVHSSVGRVNSGSVPGPVPEIVKVNKYGQVICQNARTRKGKITEMVLKNQIKL